MSDTNKSTEQAHKMEPIGYTVEKKSLASRFSSLFLADSLDAIKTHIFEKVIVPNLIRFVADSFHASIDAFFYKKNGVNPTGGWTSWTSGGSFVNNYSGMFNQQAATMAANNDITQYKYLGWPTKELAEQALVRLRGDIAQYGATSINTYLSLMDRTGPINGWSWGWRNLDQASTYSSGGLWYISFPEPVKIR